MAGRPRERRAPARPVRSVMRCYHCKSNRELSRQPSANHSRAELGLSVPRNPLLVIPTLEWMSLMDP